MSLKRIEIISKAPRWFAVAGLAATLGLFGACGGDEENDDNGGGSGTGTQGSACSSNSECGTGLICVPTQSQALEQKDMACFISCATACGMDEACAAACLEECDVTCADVCEGDADCIADCEAGGSGGGDFIPWSEATPGMCEDTCEDANDGFCDDGRPGSGAQFCDPGTDCGDCGPVPGGSGGGGEEVTCAEFCADFPAEQQAACIAACDGAGGGGGGGGEVPSTCAEFCADFPAEFQAECIASCEADDGVIGGGDSGSGSGGGDGGSGGGGGTATGTCQPDPNAGGGGGADAGGTPDAGGGGEDTGGGEEPINWAGTWIVDASYTVSCEIPLQPTETESHSHSRTVSITTDGNGGVNAVFNVSANEIFEMSGVGSESRLTLNGFFPALDSRGDIANDNPNRQNAISITLDDIQSNSSASGSISGAFVDSGAGTYDCTIQDGGTVTFSR